MTGFSFFDTTYIYIYISGVSALLRQAEGTLAANTLIQRPLTDPLLFTIY
jgi:hypothetical protein